MRMKAGMAMIAAMMLWSGAARGDVIPPDSHKAAHVVFVQNLAAFPDTRLVGIGYAMLPNFPAVDALLFQDARRGFSSTAYNGTVKLFVVSAPALAEFCGAAADESACVTGKKDEIEKDSRFRKAAELAAYEWVENADSLKKKKLYYKLVRKKGKTRLKLARTVEVR